MYFLIARKALLLQTVVPLSALHCPWTLVSFIGSVPADNPQVAIYVVVDEANSEDQAHSYYAQSIAREILKEALPYLGIYPDEELTGVNEGVCST